MQTVPPAAGRDPHEPWLPDSGQDTENNARHKRPDDGNRNRGGNNRECRLDKQQHHVPEADVEFHDADQLNRRWRCVLSRERLRREVQMSVFRRLRVRVLGNDAAKQEASFGTIAALVGVPCLKPKFVSFVGCHGGYSQAMQVAAIAQR